jgi:Protein of unknown function (DUF2442)
MTSKWPPLTDDEFARQYAEALERSSSAETAEPRAVSARYDRETGRLELALSNGCLFAVPAALLQGMEGATPEQLEAVEVWGDGDSLHWEELDADFGVEGLLDGRFGSRKWLAQWGGSGWSAPAPPVPAEMERPEPVRQRKAS